MDLLTKLPFYNVTVAAGKPGLDARVRVTRVPLGRSIMPYRHHVDSDGHRHGASAAATVGVGGSSRDSASHWQPAGPGSLSREQ